MHRFGAALIAAALLLTLAAPSSQAVTLISRSSGLELPSKEEGNTEFEFGDVNGDGELDLVSVGDHGSPYVNSDQHGIMVWLGNGAGSWTVHQFGNFGYGGCALGDLNLDGLTDVAWGVHHNWGSGMDGRLMGAALGDGSGAFWTDYGQGLASHGESWGMFATALGDFDQDGLLDIACLSFGGSNGLRVYRNNGDGTWTQGFALTGGSVGSTIETADVNADGHMDIVCTRSGSNVLLGDGAFGFVVQTAGLPASGIHGIAVGDINGDGLVDISFGYSSSGLRCYTFDGSQWVEQSNGLPTSGYHDLTQLGDIDGDGHLDLVAYDPPVGKLFLGDGAGNWTADATWQMPSPGDASALRVDGDFDHDGREDIVISASMSGFPFYRNQLRAYSPWNEPAELSARVDFPRGGEAVRPGTVRFIRWRAAVPPAQGTALVDLELSVSGPDGPWTSIAQEIPNNGLYQWAVSAPGPSEDARVRVTVTTASGSASAVSPAGFRIVGDPSGVAEGSDPEGTSDEGDGASRPDGGNPADSEPGATPFRITLSPNPARDRIRFQIHGLEGLPAAATLFDTAGRVARTLSMDSKRSSGEISLQDESGQPLASGIYHLRIQSGNRSRTARFVHIR